jgi:2,3-bisphosphoglycerate-independent phosphoglycerate mutase
MPRVLLVFVDGVGLGDDDASTNPFLSAALPALRSLLGTSRLVRDRVPIHSAGASLVGIDATLNAEGVPQSGTGQAALLTGLDAVALHGRHFGPWVPLRLRPIVREQSLLRRAQQAGCTVAFANAYPEEVLAALDGEDAGLPSDNPRSGGRRRNAAAFLRAGPPLAALGAGLLNRHTPDLVTGNAVASEITNEGWRERLGRTRVPVIDAVRAGRNLARIAQEHHLTLFAHYATDYAGHARDMDAAVLALERFDSFLGGLVDEAAADLLTIVVSDHGNIEDTTTGHTRNPALGLVIGNGHAPVARRLRRLTDVAPAVLDVLAL